MRPSKTPPLINDSVLLLLLCFCTSVCKLPFSFKPTRTMFFGHPSPFFNITYVVCKEVVPLPLPGQLANERYCFSGTDLYWVGERDWRVVAPPAKTHVCGVCCFVSRSLIHLNRHQQVSQQNNAYAFLSTCISPYADTVLHIREIKAGDTLTYLSACLLNAHGFLFP